MDLPSIEEDLITLHSDFIESPDLLWILLQTADEVLDSCMVVEYYALSRQTAEYGGNHSVVGIEHYFLEIMEFLDLASPH